jgi:hypothetical protein
MRTKSTRALESEGTEAHLAAQGPARATRSKAPPKEKAPPKPKKSKYCVCKEYRTGPMIECGQCGNWFHFGCVDLTDDEAEKIRESPDRPTFPPRFCRCGSCCFPGTS